MKIVKSTDVVKKQVETDGAKDVTIRVLIGPGDGAENFVMRMFEVQPGGFTPLHSHRHEHEVFIVAGGGTLVFEGTEHLFGCGDVIFLDGGKEHRFINTGDSLLKFLCLIPASAA